MSVALKRSGICHYKLLVVIEKAKHIRNHLLLNRKSIFTSERSIQINCHGHRRNILRIVISDEGCRKGAIDFSSESQLHRKGRTRHISVNTSRGWPEQNKGHLHGGQ